MQIFAELEELLHSVEGIPAVPVISPETGASQVSMVVAAVESGSWVPQHAHRSSEDCFVVLSGIGRVIEQNRQTRVETLDAVWVPAGVPHGLIADGASRLVEVGFLAPPDPARHASWELETSPKKEKNQMESKQVQVSMAIRTNQATSEPPRWVSVFSAETSARLLSLSCCELLQGQEVEVAPSDRESVVVVARGAIRLNGQSHKLAATSALFLEAGEKLDLTAVSRRTTLLRGIPLTDTRVVPAA